MLTKPYNSNKEFCNGVAVKRILGASVTASLIDFAILLPALYTFRNRWASSITTKSQPIDFI